MSRGGELAVPGRQRGFTLLEAIVTLVIVSMLVTALMQVLTSALGIRTRLLHHQETARVAFLQEGWFRDAVASAQIDDSDGSPAFEGKVDALDYIAASPLFANGMGRVRWFLKADGDGGMALHYADAGNDDQVVIPGPLRDAGFSYMGKDQAWTGDWVSDPVAPSVFDDSGKPASEDPRLLPRLVRFQATTPNGRLYWLVPIEADAALPKLSDLGVTPDAAKDL